MNTRAPQIRGREPLTLASHSRTTLSLIAFVVLGAAQGTCQADRIAVVPGRLIAGPLRVTDSFERGPVVDRCDDPLHTIGYLRGVGQVEFVVTSRGTADVSTLVVRDSSGVSAAAIGSVARRLLPLCRFSPAQHGGRATSALATQWLKFHTSDSIPPAAIVPYRSPSATRPDPAVVWPGPGLEEWPALKTCDLRLSPQYSGHYRFRYIIDTSGAVVRSSIVVLQGGPTELAEEIASIPTRCRYSAGRVRRVPVSVEVEHEVEVP